MENHFKLRTGWIFTQLPISNQLLVHNTYEHVFFHYQSLMNIRFFFHDTYLPSATLPGPKCYDGHWTADIFLHVIIYRFKVKDGMFDMENAFSARIRSEPDIFGSNFEPHLGRSGGPGLRDCQHIMSWRLYPSQWPTIYTSLLAVLLKEVIIYIAVLNIGYCLFWNRIYNNSLHLYSAFLGTQSTLHRRRESP